MNFSHLLRTNHPENKEIPFDRHDIIETTTHSISLIISGIVVETNEANGRPHINRLLGPGDIFPLYIPWSSSGSGKTPHTYQATVWWKLVPISIQQFDTSIHRNSHLTTEFMRYVANTLQVAEQRVERQAFLSASKRCIQLLLHLANNEQFSKDFDGQKEIKCWLTQTQLASLAWCTRQTITTIVNDLSNQWFLKYDRNRILIRDIQKLQAYAQGL